MSIKSRATPGVAEKHRRPVAGGHCLPQDSLTKRGFTMGV